MSTQDGYISPITKVHSTFAEAKEFFDKFGAITFFDDEEKFDIETLIQGKRTLIVGEPGVGKTLLLGKMKDHLIIQGFSATVINLRDNDALQQIDTFFDTKKDLPSALLLDALDEVKSSTFPTVLQKIEEVSKKYPDVPLYISGRWVFVTRYANSFPEFRFVTISPFTRSQIRKYLISAGRAERDVDTLLNRVMSFSHLMLVIQIPRYLFYLNDYLKEKGVDAASKVSRNDLFEYFIYKKLELEEEKLNEDKRAITKRVLEKLGLTMEIYQTNVITQDELMTFFDDLKSDLKIAALSQVGINVFYEYSLLKVSQENLDKIEFENTEFQEYLAAKEITRFADPNRIVFSFAVDPDMKEIYPTWYNALTFLVDMQPSLLEQLVEFSGLRSGKFKILDETFFHFLSRVDPRNVPTALRISLFKDIIEYHRRTRQWLPGQITQTLSDFYDSSLESQLKVWVADAELQTDASRYVPLANIAYTVESLFQNGIFLEKQYWREKLIKWTGDTNDSGVLQRHALQALEEMGDPSVIDDPAIVPNPDELVSQAFLSMCITLDPDHPKTLEYAFDAISRDNHHGRYVLYEFKKLESIKAFLKKFNEDEIFCREFLDDSGIFQDTDSIIVDRIKAVTDDDVRKLSKEALVRSVHYNVAHNAERSVFVRELWNFLRKDDSNFVLEMVRLIQESEGGKTGLYFAHSFFAQIIELEDVRPFIQAMLDAGEKYSAFTVMTQIKLSKRSNAQELYEAGRPLLSDDYKKWEEGQSSGAINPDDEHAKNLLNEFRILLEPKEGFYSQNVFIFYNDNAERLDPLLTEEDKARLTKLFTDFIFKLLDPAKYKLTITEENDGSRTFTTSTAVYIFGSALIAAKRLKFDLNPYRQQMLNFIPFAHTEELRAIFELVKNIKSEEMENVSKVYTDRDSDLWRYVPENFVEAIKEYHIAEATPVLKNFVTEPAIKNSVRQDALILYDSLAPDAIFLKEVFEKYKESDDKKEQNLAYTANGLLITTHADADAIRWRLNQILVRAGAYIQARGGHIIGDLEDEISHSRSFAKPLMNLKHSGYEQDYLKLLNDAMDIWIRGVEFHAYAQYTWEIVYAYFDNLKEGRSYDPLQKMEKAVSGMAGRDGGNWLAGRMAHLRRAYLGYLGKPGSIASAIVKYNKAREYNDKKILNSEDLFYQLQNVLETDLRQWIEGEGAYDLILKSKTVGTERRGYEKLIQTTLPTQIKYMMLKRGLEVDVSREAQLLDDKRVDFLVRYGFTGPIIIEVKLTSNTDIKSKKAEKIESSPSYMIMRDRYMEGYGATHGIFLVIDNTSAKNLPQIRDSFQKIKNVSVISIDCHKSHTAPKQRKRKPATKRTSKKTKTRTSRRPKQIQKNN